MLVAKSLSKGKIVVFVVIIIIAVGASGYFLYQGYLKDKINISNPFAQSSGSDLFGDNVYLPEVKRFDEQFFTSPEIQRLNNSAKLPLTADNVGKANPFTSPPPVERRSPGRF